MKVQIILYTIGHRPKWPLFAKVPISCSYSVALATGP